MSALTAGIATFAGMTCFFLAGLTPALAMRATVARPRTKLATTMAPGRFERRPRAVELQRNVEAELPEAPPAAMPARAHSMAPLAPEPDLRELKAALDDELTTLPICRRGGGPEGPGVATVTFTSDGHVRTVLSEPFDGTSVGACIARRFGHAATPFVGAPVTLRIPFDL